MAKFFVAFQMHFANQIKMLELNGKISTDASVCSQGYHGILCGACDDTHGKTKSGSCMDCSPRIRHIVMAIFLALWSIAIIALVLRRALSCGGSDGIGHQDDEIARSSSIALAGQATCSESNILRENQEWQTNTDDALSNIKDAQLSKSAREVVESSEEFASSSTRKLYVSEIWKVSNTV